MCPGTEGAGGTDLPLGLHRQGRLPSDVGPETDGIRAKPKARPAPWDSCDL
jgi:hypothetical protein